MILTFVYHTVRCYFRVFAFRFVSWVFRRRLASMNRLLERVDLHGALSTAAVLDCLNARKRIPGDPMGSDFGFLMEASRLSVHCPRALDYVKPATARRMEAVGLTPVR